MKVSGIDIESSVENIKQQIEADKTLSSSMRTTLDLLLLIVNLLCQRLGLNSSNSSKPPSSPYYRYDCLHSLCNAHHLRELTRANEQDGQVWAETMRLFLVNLNQSVLDKNDVISKKNKPTTLINTDPF